MEDLALGGVCTVALAKTGEELHGTDEFEAVHDGLTYRFASSDARTMFQADPDAFAVRFHGYCPVAASVHSMFKRGNPEIFSMYEGRPVFFADEDAKAMFDEDPAKFMANHEM